MDKRTDERRPGRERAMNAALHRRGNRSCCASSVTAQPTEFVAVAVVLVDASIGDGAKTGAGSVVIRDMAQAAVLAGSPAREVARYALRT